ATNHAPGFIYLIIAFIFIALVFDFLNGFHDAANSIATIVATRVLSPTQAVLWAAIFNFVAAFVFGTKVAGTISNDMVDNKLIDIDRKSTRLNSSHRTISYAVFCLKKKKKKK